MLVAIVLCGVSIAAPYMLEQPLWTPIHAVALGVVSNGIFQWSWFFSRGLLHFPVEGAAKYSTFVRLIVFNVGVILLFAAMWTGGVPLALVATVLICGAGIHQGIVLGWQAHKYRENRYAPIVRYYSLAFFMFVLTCLVGGLLSYETMASGAPQWFVVHADGIAVVHSILGVGGWAAITILGTVVTLGLSMLHARQDSRALGAAGGALPLFIAAVFVASIGALANLVWMVAAGVVIFLLASWWGILRPLWQSFGVRKRSSHSVWPLLAGLLWSVGLLVAFAVECAVAADITAVRELIISQLGIFIAAGIGQIFVASLLYLVPVAIGGGPTVQRVGDVTVSFLWPVRLAARNAALVVLLLAGNAAVPDAATLTTAMFVAVLVCYAVDLALVACAAVKQLRAKSVHLAQQRLKKEQKRNDGGAQ
jgi:nitrite reductase (NO-forming)